MLVSLIFYSLKGKYFCSAFNPQYRSWACEFTEESTRELIRRLTVASPEKVREMAERGGALHDLESRRRCSNAASRAGAAA